jgi:hypothetical protein
MNNCITVWRILCAVEITPTLRLLVGIMLGGRLDD